MAWDKGARLAMSKGGQAEPTSYKGDPRPWPLGRQVKGILLKP